MKIKLMSFTCFNINYYKYVFTFVTFLSLYKETFKKLYNRLKSYIVYNRNFFKLIFQNYHIKSQKITYN